MILDYYYHEWTWSCVGQNSLKFKVIVEVNPKRTSKFKNQKSTEKIKKKKHAPSNYFEN